MYPHCGEHVAYSYSRGYFIYTASAVPLVGLLNKYSLPINSTSQYSLSGIKDTLCKQPPLHSNTDSPQVEPHMSDSALQTTEKEENRRKKHLMLESFNSLISFGN